MTISIPRPAPSDAFTNRAGRFIQGIDVLPTRFRSRQADLLEWLVEAHASTGTIDRSAMAALMARVAASPDQIAFRGHELADFSHADREHMRLFGPAGSDLAAKLRFFSEATQSALERLCANTAAAPAGIVHVTCTGYDGPSAAQRLVSSRGWGQKTEVLHAYHMGCYAAHPALRIALGLFGTSRATERGVDIVHTELCSIHFDPATHTPEQLVVQSLFADGFVRYQLAGAHDLEGPALELLGLHDETLPESTDSMRWIPGPLFFSMQLSRSVPTQLAAALPGFIDRLFLEAGESPESRADTFFAIHPGGPRIIDLTQRLLGLRDERVHWSREVLRDHGNMSSATLPHIWSRMLQDSAIPDGALVVSLGAGPGLTLSGALFRKHARTP